MNKTIKKPAAKAGKSKRKPEPRKTTERFTWRGIDMTATHTRDWLSDGWSHLELHVMKPKGIPIPITTTGYLSHFTEEDIVKAAGGPAAFFLAWLDRETHSKAYKAALGKWRQLDLFG